VFSSASLAARTRLRASLANPGGCLGHIGNEPLLCGVVDNLTLVFALRELFRMSDIDPQMMFPLAPRFGDRHVSFGADFVFDGLVWTRVDEPPKRERARLNRARAAAAAPWVEEKPAEREIF
jgi:hypothetical protein